MMKLKKIYLHNFPFTFVILLKHYKMGDTRIDSELMNTFNDIKEKNLKSMEREKNDFHAIGLMRFDVIFEFFEKIHRNRCSNQNPRLLRMILHV